MVIRAVVLFWLGRAFPTILANARRAWGESRGNEFGLVLTFLYLLSAVVSGLLFQSDLRPTS
jgi:hypothetical protein